jgi:hypothetical protein
VVVLDLREVVISNSTGQSASARRSRERNT